MMLSQADFPHLKWSALFFLLSSGVAAAALMLSDSQLARAQREQQAAQCQLNEAQHQLSAARNRHAAVQDDQKNMAAYALEYAALVDRGIIGSGQRLDWVEELDKIRRQNLVPDFNYTIAPEQPYTPPVALESGRYDLKLSMMALRFDLLHEEQLMNFLDALRSGMKGRFILERCAMERSSTAPENISMPPLRAECTGGWLTLQNRRAK